MDAQKTTTVDDIRITIDHVPTIPATPFCVTASRQIPAGQMEEGEWYEVGKAYLATKEAAAAWIAAFFSNLPKQ